MAWRRIFWLLMLAAAGLPGCRQHIFMTEEDFRRSQSLALATTATPDPNCPPVTLTNASIITTAENPAAQRRPIPLAECIAIALENGRTGSNFGRRVSTTGVAPGGIPGVVPTNASDSLRVFAF